MKIFSFITAALFLSATSITSITQAQTEAAGTTKFKTFFTDSVDFSNQPKRRNNRFPLSDQSNKGGWVKVESASDEFKGKKLNEERWYDYNPGWVGRQPTQFHPSNVAVDGGNLVFSINKHGDEKLLDGYTHSSGFIVSKKKYKYGYFEARLKCNDSPWVAGFWITGSDKDHWIEIDICENCPGAEKNANTLNSNVHIFRTPAILRGEEKNFSISKKYYIPFRLEQDFHVWGCEWTEDVIRFYIDGVMFREQENTHWHYPQQINLNNESNVWLGAVPDDSRLDEVYLVDYVRVWQKK